MDKTKRETTGGKKLVELAPVSSLRPAPKPKGLTKKRYHAEPEIRAHVVNGKRYYFYRRGTDKEIYLGSARHILRMVKGENG